jgi:hypothetical protein
VSAQLNALTNSAYGWKFFSNDNQVARKARKQGRRKMDMVEDTLKKARGMQTWAHRLTA